MGITMTTTGRSGKPERPSFYPEGRTYSPPAKQAVVSLPSVGPCALRGGLRSLRRALANAAVYPCRHCLCGWQTAFALFASSLQTVVLCRDNLPSACENLPPAAFSQQWTMHPPHRPFSFAAPKETKPPLAGGRKEVKNYGDLSSGSKGREPWHRPLRLRGVGLSELQRHLQ